MFNQKHTTDNTSIRLEAEHELSPELIAKINTSGISAKAFKKLDNLSVEDIFRPISEQDWAMWLDSGNSEHVDSRFDILVGTPIATIVTTDKTTEISLYEHSNLFDNKSRKTLDKYQRTDDPLALIKNLQSSLFTQLDSTHEFIPFLGGALGYFSYDLGRHFEKLPELATQDINLPEMAVGLYNQALIYDNTTQQYYLVCPEELRGEIETSLLQNILPLSGKNNACTDRIFFLKSEWQSNMSESDYRDKFTQVQEYLLAGDCYQINLAQRFQAQYQGNEFEAYSALRTANKAPFSAFIRLENAAILSISPERFLQLSQGKVQSKPIKGTMPRSADRVEDKNNASKLKHSIKDKAENLMIVDLLRNDISRSCLAGTVTVPKLFDIESFPAVHHLVSTVEGKLADDKHATDLLRGAFPGGSITGAPKIRAMEVIEELEPHRRSIYCGSIGYISNCGTMDTSITIRTLICQSKKPLNIKPLNTQSVVVNETETPQNTIFCWAGGGIVADSTAESEYQETFDKVNCILPVLSKLNKKLS